MLSRKVWLAAQLLVLAADPHTRAVEEWRKQYEAGLREPYAGWLSVAGLYWLQTGECRVGAAEENDIVLPRGPARAGSFLFDGRSVKFRDANGVVRGMRTDTSGAPDTLEIAGMRLVAIERNGKFGIRLRDAESRMRREFQGTRWYPVAGKYRLKGRFVRHPHPRTVNFADQTGNVQKMVSPGVVEFTLDGRRLRLEPVEDEGQLFFVFKDRTAGRGTYGAGRFLYAPLPKGETAEIDFNMAKNPPCVFTPYATCPLPPRQNILPVAIPAGEKLPAGH
jgi:uncharacterized protein